MKTISCKQAKQLFSNYFDETLQADSKSDLERHLRDCPRCASEYESYRSIFSTLRKMEPVQAPDGFEARLFARIRREETESVRHSWWRDLGRIPFPMPLAAAALLLVAVFSYTQFLSRPQTPDLITPAGLVAGDTVRTRENTIPSFLSGARPPGGVGVSTVSGSGTAPRGEGIHRLRVDTRSFYDQDGRILMGPFLSGPDSLARHSSASHGVVDTSQAR